jgi:hypothetical protein
MMMTWHYCCPVSDVRKSNCVQSILARMHQQCVGSQHMFL